MEQDVQRPDYAEPVDEPDAYIVRSDYWNKYVEV